MSWCHRIWRRSTALRLLTALLGLIALTMMPVRALSAAALHQPVTIQATDRVDVEQMECPLHQAMVKAVLDHHDNAATHHAGSGKGAGPCCVAWCVSIGMPASPQPVAFPSPDRLIPPTAMAAPESRHPAPPLRPPRG